MPVGGLDSVKIFEALRIRPCSEEVFDCSRLRFGVAALLILLRRGLVGDSVNEGNGSGEDSSQVGDTFLIEVLVWGGVEEIMFVVRSKSAIYLATLIRRLTTSVYGLTGNNSMRLCYSH
jgi:hypothetical protein